MDSVGASQPQTRPPRVQFSAFEVNLASRELFKHGTRIRLQKQPFEILCMLLERPGQIVSREELRDRLWPNNTFVEYEDSLNTAVRKLRSALSDSSELPRYIETVARQGYRFIAPVVYADSAKAQSISHPASVQSDGERTDNSEALGFKTAARWWRKPRIVYAAAVFLVAASLGAWFMLYRPRRPQPPPAKIMLAVLPFQNLTGDASQEYFSDGLTEEMISQLGRLDPQHLQVIARTSVMYYKSGPTRLDQIGRDLGVQYVIEGSVRRDANRVRVAAQLIQVKNQTEIWSRQYDRELNGILSLQGEIAQEIADETQLALSDRKLSPKTARPAKNYEAYDLYLKGEYFFNKRSTSDLRLAIDFFQRATVQDPNYALAYAGLADACALMPGYSAELPGKWMPQARAAALKALQIDPNLSEAHTALALIVQNYDWDWKTAEKEFRRAIELNPNYATAHHWYAEHLMWQGRFDEALQESERARMLDPLSLIIAADNGAILYFSRKYDRAIKKWQTVLEMDPDFPRAQMIIAALVEKGMFSEALATVERQRKITPDAWYWACVAYIQGHAGKMKEAQHALDQLLQLDHRERIDPVTLGQAYAGMNDKVRAIAWLDKAYAQHSNELTGLKVDPQFDSLRGEPRFQDLLHRVGF
jgi:TolB-like protein/DNA-binding winged helix-turn-helix (wHTH) protein/Flp pilus assembly protein TadD